MRILLALTVALACGPAIAETCRFEAPNGPALDVSGPLESVVVHTGDWDETCRVELDDRGDTHIPGVSGWIIPSKLVCRSFEGQIAYVDGSDHKAIVFNGLTFMRKSCE